jgi:hypothetical protein
MNLRPLAGVYNEHFSGYEHGYCRQNYTGTAVHYLANPDQKALTEVYLHDHDGILDLYNVKALREDLRNDDTVCIELELLEVLGMMQRNDLKAEDAADVAAIRKAKGTYDEPVMVVLSEDGTQAHVIDGNHRIVAKALSGIMHLDGYVLTPHRVRNFVRRNVPQDLMERATRAGLMLW